MSIVHCTNYCWQNQRNVKSIYNLQQFLNEFGLSVPKNHTKRVSLHRYFLNKILPGVRVTLRKEPSKYPPIFGYISSIQQINHFYVIPKYVLCHGIHIFCVQIKGLSYICAKSLTNSRNII